ncbi:MAG: flagellar hook protein [Lachnospiraceae bacterium]|nr:flagellar hook protein [Lachnospiraceae bacterium]
MVVQHNLRAMNANRMLGITQGTLSKSAEKLSSGYKVNRAADDAAGLSISEKMRKQIRGLTQASLNAEDGISAVQTAEGALTEVHDMLQRMNELAAKAANGTNALSDRQTIQDEVDQLLTEIDRVAETTKFNETYLLKGDKDTVTKYVNAKDAGLEGTLSEGAVKATFTMNTLKVGDTIQIAGKSYTIGEYEKASDLDAPNTDPDTMYTRIKTALGLAQAGEQITLDGVQYTVIDDADTENADKNMLKTVNIVKKVAEGSHAVYKGTNYYAMKDSANPQTGEDELNGGIRKDDHANGIDDTNANVITAQKAYEMIYQELILANNIGTDVKAAEIDENTGMLLTNSTGKDIDGGTVNDTTIAKDDLGDHDAIVLGASPNIQGQIKEAAYEYSVNIDTTNGIINLTTNDNYRDKIRFVINKGQVNVKENLNFSLHVGADADMTNKISVGIEALDTAGLGIKGLNVKDSTGAAATYAIDSIADAIATVSSQRSLLGAVQNRLEHTINNLNNVVENTTSAESQIRDTNMATEMVKYSNANILSQAGQSMLAQGNQSNQGVLSLLG